MDTTTARPAVVFFAAVPAALIVGLLSPDPRLFGLPYTLVGLAVIALGFSLGMAQRRAMVRHHQSGIYIDVPTRLITDGPFRFSRNPLYLGMVLMTLGVGLLFGKIVPLAVALVAFVLMNVWVIPPEEAVLREALTDEYAAYRDRVRRWI